MGLEGTEIQISKMAANKWAKMILGDGGGAGRIRAPAKRRRRLRSCISSRAIMLCPTYESATFVFMNLGLDFSLAYGFDEQVVVTLGLVSITLGPLCQCLI